MSFSHKNTSRWDRGAGSVSAEKSYVGEGENNVNAPIAFDDANAEIAFELVIAQLVSIFMVADQDITVYTNAVSGGAPDETIALKANVPFIQNADIAAYFAGATNLLATDIAKLFVTATGAVATTLQIRCVYDATV